MISHKNHPNSKKSKNLHLTCFASFTLVGGSGFFQSFLLIRELILERLPQPLHTPELMEPIEPAEGGEDLQGGGVWARPQLKILRFLNFLNQRNLKTGANFLLSGVLEYFLGKTIESLRISQWFLNSLSCLYLYISWFPLKFAVRFVQSENCDDDDDDDDRHHQQHHVLWWWWRVCCS